MRSIIECDTVLLPFNDEWRIVGVSGEAFELAEWPAESTPVVSVMWESRIYRSFKTPSGHTLKAELMPVGWPGLPKIEELTDAG